MTSIVGVVCQDGVVIGADSAATFGPGPPISTIEQETHKIDLVAASIIVAGTGQVGLHQRFTSIVSHAHDGTLHLTLPPHLATGQAKQAKVFTRQNPHDVTATLCRAAVEDLGNTYMRLGQYGALLAFSCANEPYLCEFALSDFQPEFKERQKCWYVSMGSAQMITDPFLGFIRRVFWEKGAPSLADGILAVVWTLQHAIELNTGGVNGPIRVATLSKGASGKYVATAYEESDLGEHQQSILDAHAALRDFKSRQKTDSAEAPAPPVMEPQ